MTAPDEAVPVRDAVAATLHDLGVDVAFSLLGSSNFQLVQRLVDRHGVRHYWARHPGRRWQPQPGHELAHVLQPHLTPVQPARAAAMTRYGRRSPTTRLSWPIRPGTSTIARAAHAGSGCDACGTSRRSGSGIATIWSSRSSRAASWGCRGRCCSRPGQTATLVRGIKETIRHIRNMGWAEAENYINAKLAEALYSDPERGRAQGLKQFLDEKSIRPGLEGYRR
jgi:hypothetical protein